MFDFRCKSGLVTALPDVLVDGRFVHLFQELVVASDQCEWTPGVSGFTIVRDGIQVFVECGDTVRLSIQNHRAADAHPHDVRLRWYASAAPSMEG